MQFIVCYVEINANAYKFIHIQFVGALQMLAHSIQINFKRHFHNLKIKKNNNVSEREGTKYEDDENK